MLKSGEDGLIGPGSNNYGKDEPVNKEVTAKWLKEFQDARVIKKVELDAIDSQIQDLKHQLGMCNADGSTSLEGCPFMYCDNNPHCEGTCRYVTK